MKKFNLFLMLLVFSWLSSGAWADVPRLINFQGRLTDSLGNVVSDGSYNIRFRIYDDSLAGNVLWEETTSVQTKAGLFTVLLGSTSAIPESSFYSANRWLGIKVGANSEITPRQRLASVGYSFQSNQWSSAGNDIYRNSGNVGIGTSSPLVNLHLQSIPSVNLLLDNSGTGNRWNIGVAAGNNNAIGFTYGGATKTYFQTNGDIWFGVTGGNVGIGTSTPVNKLDVEGAAAIGAAYSGAGTAPTNGLAVEGNVGIGTAAPEQKLHVFKGSAGSVTANANSVGIFENSTHSYISVISPSSFDRGILFGDEVSNVNGGIIYSGGYMSFLTNGGSNRMAINPSGNVGIGTTSPSARLHVKGAGFPNSFGYFDTDAANQDAGLRFQEAGVVKSHLFYAASTNTLDLFGEGFSGISIDAGGNVGIGTTAPTQKLHVVGNICATGSIGACSDLRYKTKLNRVSNALEKVLNLKGVYFNWKKDQYPDLNFEEDRQIGFVAQELKEILPEVVSQGTDGFYSIDYGKLTPLLVEAIKEEQILIGSLQKTIEQLEERLHKLESGTYQVAVPPAKEE